MKLTPGFIAQTATGMRAELSRLPDDTTVQRILEPYAVVLARKGDSLALHVGRRSGYVDLDEVAPFAQAFGVPLEDREPAAGRVFIDSRVGGHVRINCLTFTWREELHPLPATVHPAKQLTFFGAEPYTQGA